MDKISWRKTSRRRFLGTSGIAGASFFAGAAKAPFTNQASGSGRSVSTRQTFFDLMRPPDLLVAYEAATPPVRPRWHSGAGTAPAYRFGWMCEAVAVRFYSVREP